MRGMAAGVLFGGHQGACPAALWTEGLAGPVGPEG